MLPILATCVLWKIYFSRRESVLNCDKLEVTQSWSNRGSKCRNVLFVTQVISLVVAKANFTLTVKHASGGKIGIADAHSRVKIQGSRVLAPHAAASSKILPGVLLESCRCFYRAASVTIQGCPSQPMQFHLAKPPRRDTNQAWVVTKRIASIWG